MSVDIINSPKMNDPYKRNLVIVAATDYNGFPFGGTDALVRDYLRAFVLGNKVKVTLVGLTDQNSKFGQVESRQFGENVLPILPIFFIPRQSRRSVRAGFTFSIIRHANWIKKLKPSVLYAHSPEIGLALSLVFRNIPIVVHYHGIDNPLHLSRFKIARIFPVVALYDLLMFKLGIRLASKILINADEQQFSWFRNKYGSKSDSRFLRVPASIDMDVFRLLDRNEARRIMDLRENEKVALFVGRLVPPKGVDLIIRAFQLLSVKVATARLIIVGDGSARKSLEHLVGQLGLSSRVIFTGFLERPRLATVLNAADVFATGTLREAISMAAIEAMACGVPVVSTDVGGAKEIIIDGLTGFVLNGRDPQEMADRIAQVFEARPRMQAHCLAMAQKYSSEIIAKKVLDEIMTLA